jgi:hypothetical protein
MTRLEGHVHPDTDSSMTSVADQDSASFERRWADWQARGRERSARTNRRMLTVALVFLVGIAAAAVRVIARG